MKGVKKSSKLGITLIVAILTVLFMVGAICTQAGFKTQFAANVGVEKMTYTSDYSSKHEAIMAGYELNLRVAEEGMVLLKNENNALPIPTKKGVEATRVTVFGYAGAKPSGGSSGNGGDTSGGIVGNAGSVYSTLEAVGYKVNPYVKEFYNTQIGLGKTSDYQMKDAFAKAESQLSSSYASYSDAAFIVLNVGDTTATDDEAIPYNLRYNKCQYDLVKNVAASGVFDKVVVLINKSYPVELNDIKNDPNVDAILLIGETGTNGLTSAGPIICGDVNPSGHLSDSYPVDLSKDPSYVNFPNRENGLGKYVDAEGVDVSTGKSGFTDYEEGIYVGYRYWETRGFTDGEEWYKSNVMYPMGYGLSYSNFSWKVLNKPTAVQTVSGEDVIKVEVEVTNNSEVAGKDVVQLYYTAPYTAGGIEKAHVVLGDFAKVEVGANSSETVTLELKVSDMKSYDYAGKADKDYKGYILEAGDYEIKICQDAHTVVDTITYKVASDEKYTEGATEDSTIENRFDDVSSHITTYLSRNDWNGTFPTVPETKDREVSAELISATTYKRNDEGKPWQVSDMPETNKSNGLMLVDLLGKSYDDPNWDRLVEQLNYEDMLDLICIGNYQTIELLDKIGKPRTTDSDGPSGFTSYMGVGEDVAVYGTCTYAAETVLGATWNEELAYEMGKMVGNEGLIGNERGDKMPYSGWYAPAVNIHRSAFGGRNWEYYSEDGLLSGRMAAQVIKGCAEKGVYCTIKHFAVNEQETNRDTNGLITWLNEQSMREIYLKPFEIAVTEGKTTAVMSSFNRIGTTWAGGSYELLTEVLREEWGFKGLVITDYSLKKYMNADQMIRAGGDLSLSQGARIPDIDKYDVDATTLACMQNATHNILYTVANSNAMNVNIIGKRMPKWVRLIIVIDVVIVVALAGWGVWAILTAMKKRKSSVANSDATEVEKVTPEPMKDNKDNSDDENKS